MNRNRASIRRAAAAASVIASSLALGACGGTSERDQIVQVIKAYNLQPTKLCTQYATPSMIKGQYGSKAECLKLASAPGAKDPHVTVGSVSVKVRTAVAIRIAGSNPGKGTKAEVDLVKTSKGWKIGSISPIS